MASMQPGFGWQEEINTMLSSMSSRPASRSVMYLPTQMGRLPRYFDDLQLTVDDGQAGLDAQNVGPEGQHAGAAAALGHVVQLVQHKAQLDPLGKALQPHRNVLGGQAVCSPLGRFQHKIALPGADILAVHDADILEFACGQLRILEAGRKLAADRNMDHSIVLFGKRLKKFGIFHQICGGGFGHFAARIHIGKHICRVDGHTVQIAILAHQDVHGHQGKCAKALRTGRRCCPR